MTDEPQDNPLPSALEVPGEPAARPQTPKHFTPNKRIDAGIKRGPRKPIDRRPRASATGLFLPKFSPDQKTQIIADAIPSLQAGESTDQIASRHGITGRALRYWLLDDPLANQARRAMINGELTRTLENMREAGSADSPLPLAVAREEFRAWSWVAERREYQLYGQKQEIKQTVTIEHDIGLSESANDLLKLFRARVIEPKSTNSLIDKTSVNEKIVNEIKD